MDLMYKLLTSENIEIDTVVGIVPESKGLKIAADHGFFHFFRWG